MLALVLATLVDSGASAVAAGQDVPGPSLKATTTKTATASTSAGLRLRPAHPTVGERTQVSGTAPGRRRRAVMLQVASGGRWSTLSRSTARRSGAFTLVRRATATERLRVVAPRVAGSRHRRGLARWVSRTVVLTPRAATVTSPATPTPPSTSTPTPTPEAAPTVVLDAVAAVMVEGLATTVGARVTPIVPGRGVRLERAEGTDWVTVSTAPLAADGTVALPVTPGAAGTTEQLRAVAEAADGWSATVASAAVPVTVQAGLARVDLTTDDALPIGAAVDRDGDGDVDLDDKFAYTTGAIAVAPRGSTATAVPALGSRFRVRGNSTSWVLVKLSYKIKLDTKAALLGPGGSTSKNWVLLANFYDRSLLRNDLAFETARRMGMAWTPRMTNVEVWQNGTYVGVYQLGESIETNTDRIAIDVDGDNAKGSKAANGGYLLEMDSWPDSDPHLTTGHGAQVFLKEPEYDVASDADPYLAGVKTSLDELESALYGPDVTDPVIGYRALVDVDSFVDWYLVNELTKNVDAGFNNSVWLYRGNGGRLTMGPVWDFDLSAGNGAVGGVDDPTGWLLRKLPLTSPISPSMFTGPEGHWLNRMLVDPWFVGRVQERWSQVRTALLGLPDYLAAERTSLAAGATRNFGPVAAGGAGMPLGATFLDGAGPFFATWGENVDHLDGWLRERLAWMDEQLTAA
ncbi:CotH kinase family protein [Nocardioides sp.]|uniref:CotH kinase family protein n=1 Tax=Nocardioides sp. TaxID=35761 RepID=UPI002611E3B9|nr:CotH kinase family protein [Nocardioides sp.]